MGHNVRFAGEQGSDAGLIITYVGSVKKTEKKKHICGWTRPKCGICSVEAEDDLLHAETDNATNLDAPSLGNTSKSTGGTQGENGLQVAKCRTHTSNLFFFFVFKGSLGCKMRRLLPVAAI